MHTIAPHPTTNGRSSSGTVLAKARDTFGPPAAYLSMRQTGAHSLGSGRIGTLSWLTTVDSRETMVQ